MSTVRAKYENGVLTPLEPLDLEEGADVTVSVESASTETAENTPAPKGAGWDCGTSLGNAEGNSSRGMG